MNFFPKQFPLEVDWLSVLVVWTEPVGFNNYFAVRLSEVSVEVPLVFKS